MTSPETAADSPRPRMHYVGFCRICGTGPLGVRACGRCGDLVILCDECDSLWTHATLANPPSVMLSDEGPCPSCGYGLWEGGSHWATLGEIGATGWLARAVADGLLPLDEGAGFGDGGEAPAGGAI